MKLLYLCSDAGIPVLGRKGASVHVRELVGAFQRAGHEVVVAAPLLNKSPWEKPAAIAGHVLHVRAGGATQAAAGAVREFAAQLGIDSPLPGELRRILYVQELVAELRRRFEDDPPDFIYERAALFGLAGVTLARAWNVPLLVEVNAPLAAEQSTYRGANLGELASLAERRLLTEADAVLAVSAALREHVLAHGAAPERVHVIPNGVNPELFHPAPRDLRLRERLGLDGGPVLGFLGGLRPWHGVEALPDVLGKLSRRHRRLRLVVAGDGPLRSELERALRQRCLLARTVFSGTLPHEEVPAVVRQFDIALAPYPKLEHAFYFSPLKLFEYMACGVAVVASRVGQIAEVVTHGRTGLLCPAGDTDALVAACDRLLRDARLRRALGRAGARAVAGRFTWDANARRVAELAAQLRRAGKGGQ
jgi:glycosyltransferase involved in cell wall biosynthesis